MYSKLDIYQETVNCILYLSSFCILMLCILCGEGKTLFLRFKPPPPFLYALKVNINMALTLSQATTPRAIFTADYIAI